MSENLGKRGADKDGAPLNTTVLSGSPSHPVLRGMQGTPFMEGFMEALFFQRHLPSPETLLYADLSSTSRARYEDDTGY